MTASTAAAPGNPPTGRHGTAATLAIAIIAGSVVFALLIAAVTFGALAIAFPLAVPIAEQYHVSVSPDDMLIAEQFSRLWWVFGGFAVGTLIAAVVIVLKTISHLERRSTT